MAARQPQIVSQRLLGGDQDQHCAFHCIAFFIDLPVIVVDQTCSS